MTKTSDIQKPIRFGKARDANGAAGRVQRVFSARRRPDDAEIDSPLLQSAADGELPPALTRSVSRAARKRMKNFRQGTGGSDAEVSRKPCGEVLGSVRQGSFIIK